MNYEGYFLNKYGRKLNELAKIVLKQMSHSLSNTFFK